MFASKNTPLLLLFLLANSLTYPYFIQARPPKIASKIIVFGSVYCDACNEYTFSKHSYFLPGVDVHVQCKFQASAPKTKEQISFSVNRTTDLYGMYKLEIPSVDGVDCAEDPTIQSFCQASLIGAPMYACNIPSLRSTSTEITVKSKQSNMCTYTLGALSYKPPKRNITLCGTQKMEIPKDSWNSSKFFLPYFPPYVFPWPQFPPLPQLPPLPPWPQLPPLPPLPPFPSFPFPFPPVSPYPSFPFPPNTNPPPLPFPFPPLPPGFAFAPPPPPGFNLRDPRSWIPNYPFLPPPPPPPPAFNFWDPRTWFPRSPPSSPTTPSSLKP